MENHVEFETVMLDDRFGPQYDELFNTMNAFHRVPFLETDDCTALSRPIGICRFIKEPRLEVSLFGTTPKSLYQANHVVSEHALPLGIY